MSLGELSMVRGWLQFGALNGRQQENKIYLIRYRSRR